MKKLICTLLALSLVLAMTACGKQATETTTPETTAPEKKGCGSSVAAAAVAVCAIFGSAVVIRRKK